MFKKILAVVVVIGSIGLLTLSLQAVHMAANFRERASAAIDQYNRVCVLVSPAKDCEATTKKASAQIAGADDISLAFNREFQQQLIQLEATTEEMCKKFNGCK